MILLIDLDNTLVDRRLAFGLWAQAFIAEVGGTDADTAWLLAEDRDGYRPREALARAILDRFPMGLGCDELDGRLLHEHVQAIELSSRLPSGVRRPPVGPVRPGWSATTPAQTSQAPRTAASTPGGSATPPTGPSTGLRRSAGARRPKCSKPVSEQRFRSPPGLQSMIT